jgi:hypothetical protein
MNINFLGVMLIGFTYLPKQSIPIYMYPETRPQTKISTISSTSYFELDL